MMIASPKEWFSVSDATFNEKALYVAVLLTFFCLPLGTAPPTLTGALSAAIWLFSGIAIAKRRVYRSTYWMPVYAMAILPLIGMIYTHDKYGMSADYGGKAYYWLFGLVVAAISFVAMWLNPRRESVVVFNDEETQQFEIQDENEPTLTS